MAGAKAAKTPAFPFYGKDAYDDEKFSRASFAEQGFYVFLAWWQWQEGSIPAALDDILDKVPRKKIAEARRLWPQMETWFPVVDGQSRRRNANVEARREKALEGRGKHKIGAAITNAKRWGSESPSSSLSESLSDTDSESPRAASARATQGLSKVPSEKPGVQGGSPDWSEAASVVAKIDACALKILPPEQVAIAWLTEYGAELIVETLADCEGDYAGKHFRYLEQILTNRRDNPNERPGNRRRGSGERRAVTGKPAPKSFAGRTE